MRTVLKLLVVVIPIAILVGGLRLCARDSGAR